MAPASTGLGPIMNDPQESEDAGPQHELTLNKSTSFPVLDLPQLYSQPSPESLFAAIALLAVAPPSWAANAPEAKPAPISEDGIPSYLTRIISSPLAWIPSDADKEEVWEAASKRLAERSGRTAMPSVSRTFKIPIDPQDPSSGTIDVKLYEPSLTGDNLGHKTWVASYLLAKRLPTLLPRHFPNIKTTSFKQHNPIHPSPQPTPARPRILELGAGTGLVGIAALALFSTATHLTDLPSILPNLHHNITTNAPLTSSSTVTAAPLDWSDPGSYSFDDNNHNNNNQEGKFDLILAADSLYAPQHPTYLVNVISALLKRDEHKSARVVFELPFRSEEASASRHEHQASGITSEHEPENSRGSSEHEHESLMFTKEHEHEAFWLTREHEALEARMAEGGFVLVEEGVEEGVDDWVGVGLRGDGGARVVVRCLWWVWRWGHDACVRG